MISKHMRLGHRSGELKERKLSSVHYSLISGLTQRNGEMKSHHKGLLLRTSVYFHAVMVG